MGLYAGCNLDGRNLGKSLETFSQLKKETHKKKTDARAAVDGSLYIHPSMYTRPTLVRLKPEVKGITIIRPALDTLLG